MTGSPPGRVLTRGQLIDREGLAGRRQEVVPRPGLVADGFANPALKVPFIDEIWPELLSTTDKPSPITIKGSNFSRNSFVLLNDQIVRGTVNGDNELQINLPSGLMKAAGVYPLVVVEPGSGGWVSNTFYFMVTTK